MKKAFLILTLLSTNNVWLIGQSEIKDDSIVVNLKAAFIIDKKGELTDLKIVESDCKHCDQETLKQVEQEVVRVIKSTPGLEPPKDKSGRATSRRYILPLKVILKDDN